MAENKILNNDENKKPELIKQEGNLNLSWLNITVFFTAIFLGGMLSLILTNDKISETEKRALCQFPTFSFQSLAHGDYTDSIELYYADNFPFRESFVQLASGFKEFYGYR